MSPSPMNELVCPRQVQIPADTDVNETWWEKQLSYTYSPSFFFFSWGLQAVVKTEEALRLLQQWHQSYNALWFCLRCIFSFCGREVIHYKAKYIHNEKNIKSTKPAPFLSKNWSRQQRIITWYLFERSANNYVSFWRGQDFAKLKSLATKLKCYDKICEARPTEYKFSIWTQT